MKISNQSKLISKSMNYQKNYFLYSSSVFLCVLCGFILLFCGKQGKPQLLETAEISIMRNGEKIAVVKAELAKTEEQRAKGLMFRKELADGHGMLFIFDKEEIRSFWMENTYVPLSIAYIAANGRIVDIKDMRPLDRSSVKSNRSVRYALEVPQGWFNRANVKPGDSLVW